MRKVVFHIVVTLVLVLSGCNSRNEKEHEPKKMAVVISTLNNPWFVVLGEAAGFDAILFNPTDSEGSVSNVKRAKQANLPTFCMDREINSLDVATSQITSDNFSGCVSLGEYFVRKLNKKGKYVELLGLVGDNNTWNRSKGFHSVVDHFPELEMVAQQSADFDRSKAMEVLESVMQSNPDIDAVFCGNDAMAMGAYQALVAAGKADSVMVFGFDGAKDVMDAIKDKKISATAMQSPRQMARAAAEMADEFLKGKRDFSKKTPLQKISMSLELMVQITDYE